MVLIFEKFEKGKFFLLCGYCIKTGRATKTLGFLFNLAIESV